MQYNLDAQLAQKGITPSNQCYDHDLVQNTVNQLFGESTIIGKLMIIGEIVGHLFWQ